MKAGTRISFVFIALYLLGMLIPQSLWGVDALAFVPPGLKIGLPIAAVLAVMGWEWRGEWAEQQLARFGKLRLPKVGIFLGLALLASALCYHHPIAMPVYGDAAKFDQTFSSKAADADILSDASLILDPNVFHPKVGERTVLNSVQWLSSTFRMDYPIAFRWLGAVMGFLFVFGWLTFVNQWLSDPLLRLVMSVLGLSASFLLLFCGHLEIYAPGIVANGAFLWATLCYYRKPVARQLLVVGLCLFLAMKVHSSAFLLVPGFGLAIWYGLRHKQEGFAVWFTWKRLSLLVLLPIFLGGAVLYFGILKDHVDPRFLNPDISVYERLFLPLFSPEAPLDRYNLLSLNHLLDYGNMLLCWSAGGLFLGLSLLWTQRKTVAWQHPALLTVGLSLLLYVAFFFMVNPLLGMTIDWDLFSLPAVILLVFLVVLAAQVDQRELARQTAGGVLGLAILGLSFFYVNTHAEPLGNRLESIGAYSFKTYWIRSAAVMETGWKMMDLEKPALVKRKEAMVAQLQPYAVPGQDIEYAHVLTEIGKYYRRELKDNATALQWHLRAEEYAPMYKANLIGLLECYFFNREWEKAYEAAEKLIQIAYPSQVQSLAIGVQIALEAGRYAEAETHCAAYLKLMPGDETFRTILQNLRTGTRVEELKFLFNQQ